jgi:hypothetical protein
MPCSAAAWRNSGQGPGSVVDRISITCWVSKAARQGPSPVSYWAWSTSGAVSSVKTAVRWRPSTSIVMPHRSAAATASMVRQATRSRVCTTLPSPTKKRDRAA